MDFSLEQRLAITKSIIELSDPSESCELRAGRGDQETLIDLVMMQSCFMRASGPIS